MPLQNWLWPGRVPMRFPRVIQAKTGASPENVDLTHFRSKFAPQQLNPPANLSSGKMTPAGGVPAEISKSVPAKLMVPPGGSGASCFRRPTPLQPHAHPHDILLLWRDHRCAQQPQGQQPAHQLALPSLAGAPLCPRKEATRHRTFIKEANSTVRPFRVPAFY
jgi:hypothetical protein